MAQEERTEQSRMGDVSANFEDAEKVVEDNAASTAKSQESSESTRTGLVSTGYEAPDEYTYKAAQEIINRYQDCGSTEDAMRIALQKRGEYALARDMGAEHYRRDDRAHRHRIDILRNEFENLFIEHSKVLRLQAGVEALAELRDNQSLGWSDTIKTADSHLRAVLQEVDGLYGAHELRAQTRKLLTQLEHYDAANRATATEVEQSKQLKTLFKGIRAIERSMAKTHSRLVGTTAFKEGIANESRRKSAILGSLSEALGDYGKYLGSIKKTFETRIKAVEAELSVLEDSEKAHKALRGENQPMHPKHKVRDEGQLRQTIGVLEAVKGQLESVVENITKTMGVAAEEMKAVKDAKGVMKENKKIPLTGEDESLRKHLLEHGLSYYGTNTALGGNEATRNVSQVAEYKAEPLQYDAGWRKAHRSPNHRDGFAKAHTNAKVRTEYSGLRSGRSSVASEPAKTSESKPSGRVMG